MTAFQRQLKDDLAKMPLGRGLGALLDAKVDYRVADGVGTGQTTRLHPDHRSRPRLTAHECQATIEAQACRIAEDIGRISYLEGRVSDLEMIVDNREGQLVEAKRLRDTYRDEINEIRKFVARGDTEYENDKISTADVARGLRDDYDSVNAKWTKTWTANVAKREADRKRRGKKKR